MIAQSAAIVDAATESRVYTIESTFNFPNESSNAANDVVATIYLFDNHSGWASQQVLSEQIGISDQSATYDILSTADNRIAQISLSSIGPGDTKTVTITHVIKVDSVDLDIDPNAVQGNIPTDMLQYTQPVDYLWESDDPNIQNEAIGLTENQSNFYYKAKAIFDFVKSYLNYLIQATPHSALWAYNSGYGDCSEFTNLLIALYRAAGIPAKSVLGYGYDPLKGTDFASMGHAFAYIYLPNVGWIPVDAVWSSPEGQFGEISNDHIVLMTSDGSNLVSGTSVKEPGDKVNYTYSGTNPNIQIVSSSEITQEVAVQATLSAASQMQDHNWRFFVNVNNKGTQAVEDINVELQVDENYFEAPQAQSIEMLEAGHNQVLTFDVPVKTSAENSPIRAIITYDNPYGTFTAKSNQLLASPTLLGAQEIMSLIWIALIAAIVGAAVAVAIVLIRRR